ncbi:AraC family transcriptional regulator [Cohnella sp.]|uniref:AraC family transcriptional regulator n=1 Tax=Cohnella sp. TaxID=1883426 RepID=UPI003563F6B7
MLRIDGEEVPEKTLVDSVTNKTLFDFPVQCVFRTSDIQQAFLHSHHGYEWYLCLSGNGRFIVGENMLHVGAGTLIVVNPLVLHMPRSDAGKPFHRYILSVGQNYMDHVLRNAIDPGAAKAVARWLPTAGLDYACWQLNARQLLRVQDILTRLGGESASGRERCTLTVYSLVLQFFAGLGRREAGPAVAVHNGKTRKRLAEEIMGYVAEHYTESFGVEDLCRRFHLSRSYLHRIFKRETGISVNEYVIAYRVNKAKGLLESGTLRLTEVAMASGFRDLSHFFHMFKRLTGVTPGRYRIGGATLNGDDERI